MYIVSETKKDIFFSLNFWLSVKLIRKHGHILSIFFTKLIISPRSCMPSLCSDVTKYFLLCSPAALQLFIVDRTQPGPRPRPRYFSTSLAPAPVYVNLVKPGPAPAPVLKKVLNPAPARPRCSEFLLNPAPAPVKNIVYRGQNRGCVETPTRHSTGQGPIAQVATA